jgi:DNA-binding MarR family transcriptional regulator
MAESFVDTFKTELIKDRVWESRSQMEPAVVQWFAWPKATALRARRSGSQQPHLDKSTCASYLCIWYLEFMTTNRVAEGTANSAVRLALAVSRFRARLREEAGIPTTGLSLSQFAILWRIIEEGPATASELAATEHVSQQAIAQSISPLKSAGLLEVQPDPTDRRKSRLDVTSEGRRLVDSVRSAKESWLTETIDATVGTDELEALEKAVELLERIAAAEVNAKTGLL